MPLMILFSCFTWDEKREIYIHRLVYYMGLFGIQDTPIYQIYMHFNIELRLYYAIVISNISLVYYFNVEILYSFIPVSRILWITLINLICFLRFIGKWIIKILFKLLVIDKGLFAIIYWKNTAQKLFNI